MLRKLILITAMMALPGLAAAPIQNMSIKSLGVEYCGMLRGQLITAQKVPTHERIQMVYLHYAPVQYLMFSLGVGGDRMAVDKYNNMQFNGKYGFSPAARIALFTPRFISSIFSITAGGEFLHLNTADGDYSYTGPVLDPYAGIKISSHAGFDFEIGGRGHFIFGTMKNAKSGATASFSNEKILRGYGSATLMSPGEGAYLQLYFDASPQIGKDWSQGPAESTVGASVGIILRPHQPASEVKENPYFPYYKDMKLKQDEMGEQIEK